MDKDMTPEEAILKMRQMVQAITGIDPRLGRKAKPARQLTKKEMAFLFKGKDEQATTKD